MLLDLRQQQDLALLLFGDLEGIGASNAPAFRMNGQGQGESVQLRHMKYRDQGEFDKIRRGVIVVIKDDVVHARAFWLNLISFEKIESRFVDRFSGMWIWSCERGSPAALIILWPIRNSNLLTLAARSPNSSLDLRHRP